MGKLSMFRKCTKMSSTSTCYESKKLNALPQDSNEGTNYFKAFQYKLHLAAFLTLTNAFLYGNTISFGLVLDQDLVLDFPRYEQRNYYFAIVLYHGFGHIAGSSIAKLLCQYLGALTTLKLSSISLLFAWLCMLVELPTAHSILCVRFFHGFSASLVAISTLVYLCDISLAKNRAFMLASFTTATLLGTYFPMLFCLKEPYFCTMIILMLNLLAILALCVLPESPVWLAGTSNDPNDMCAAEQALKKLRISSNPCATLFEVNRVMAEKDQTRFLLLDHPLFYKPLRVSFMLMLLHQCTFANLFYLFGRPMPFLLDYFGHSNLTNASISAIIEVDSNETGVMAAIQLVTLLVVTFLVLRFFERRTILVTAGCILAILNLCQGIMLHSKSPNEKAFTIVAYVASVFSTTIESVSWVAVVEMVTYDWRVYSCICAWQTNWFLTMVSLHLMYNYGSQCYILIISSFMLVIASIYLCMKMPNTKSRTTGQIIRQFIGKT